MSDEEDEYEYEYDEDDDGGMDDGDGNGGNNDDNDDDEDNNFEYTDEEEDHDDAEVALENAYYNAKGLREVDLNQAAAALEQVIHQEQTELEKTTAKPNQHGSWSYKAMKQLVKLHLRAAVSCNRGNNSTSKTDTAMGSPDIILHHYNRLLQCVSVGDVSPAAVEKGISGMLERVARTYGSISSNASFSNSTNGDIVMSDGDEHNNALGTNPQSLALAVYDATLKVFHPITGPCKNERLWFKTNLKYGQLLYEMNETIKLQQVLKDLLVFHNNNNDDGNNNRNVNSMNQGAVVGSGNSTNSMEIYALQIQLYSRQKDHKKLRETYQRAMNVMGGIPHPRTLALIHELGGKMHMSSREYEAAGKTFFQAFKSYDEAGDISRLRCLKYLVLASMLHASSINPFDSQEARPYRDDPEIVTMTELVSAFHNNEIQKFETILKKNSKQLLGDEFIREHVEDLLRTIRTQVLRRVIRPYTRISLKAIAAELNDIPVADVEKLLVHLILDGNLDGKIDRVDNVLLKRSEKGSAGGTTDVVTASGGSASGSITSGGSSDVNTMAGSSSGEASGSASVGGMNVGGHNKSDIVLQCEAMDTMIGLLDELADQVTSTSFYKDSGGTTRSSSGFGGSVLGGMQMMPF